MDQAIKNLGDKIANLTMLEARELAQYIENEYGITPPSMPNFQSPPDPHHGDSDQVEQTSFGIKLVSFGDRKLNVIKAVRIITGGGLVETKKLVEAVPATIKEEVDGPEANRIKADLEDVGAVVELV